MLDSESRKKSRGTSKKRSLTDEEKKQVEQSATFLIDENVFLLVSHA